MRKQVLIPAIDLNHRDGRPKYEQLRIQIRSHIEKGVLKPGDRLPGIRKLAAGLAVSPDTVKRAYLDLCDEGLLEAKPRSGFLVTHFPTLRQAPVIPVRMSPLLKERPLTPQAELANNALAGYESVLFTPGPFVNVPTDMINSPDPAWTKLAAQQARMTWSHTGYSDPRGFLPLREAISEHLRRYRGISADPSQIVITTGTVQGLSIAARIFFKTGDVIAVESPGSRFARQILNFQGLNFVRIPVDSNGLNTEKLCNSEPLPAGVYVTSSSQYPLGTELSPTRRIDLVKWALNHNSWIIEDDYNCFPRLSTEVSAPIRSVIGAENCTVFLSSFSTTLYPGVRVGFTVLPSQWAGPFAGAKFLSDRQNPENLQAVLAQYLQSGDWETHMRKLTKRYRCQYQFFQQEAKKGLSRFGRLIEHKSGLYLVFLLNAGISDSEAARILSKKGIYVRTLSSFSENGCSFNGFLFGYAYPPEIVTPALETVKRVLAKLNGEKGT